MSHCPECGEAYMDGALFCGECGASLLLEANRQPALMVSAHEIPDARIPTHSPDYQLGFGIKADRIVFDIPSSGRRLEARLGQTISIGRLDASQGIWPDVDLTSDDGAEKGVSRRHALMRNSDEDLVLVDLGSTNGTHLNDRRLSPERPYLLRNGDWIRFGDLLVRVHFET